MKNKKKVLIAALGILGIVLTTAGVTVAWFTYSRTGTKENTITTGSIKFHYAEGSRTIDVDDMMPMTDAQGKAQDDYFEFTITSDTSRTLDIPYYITARRTASSDANMDSIVKVYLTKVDDNGVETQVLLSKVGSLSAYSNSAINIPSSEKTLYNDTVLAETQGYTQKYRLRMWIDTDAKYIVQEENQPDQYPLQDKSYALTVNVYSTGEDIGEEEAKYRNSSAITSLSIDNKEIISADGINYAAELQLVASEVTKIVDIETENPNSTVTIHPVDSTGMIMKNSGIKKLSSAPSLITVKIGTNNYLITVTNPRGTQSKNYNLTITGVTPPSPNNFQNDSWETIVYAIRNNLSLESYRPVSGNSATQSTKTIDMGSLGTHTLRVANITPCSGTLTSETACGFVVEFADIIEERQLHNYGTSVGGYPSTTLYTYLNDTVYNAIPEEIRKYMLDTTMVSGHGRDVSNPLNLETDANHNFITRNEKIYLFDEQEIKGDNASHNTASTTTRKLDIYTNCNDCERKGMYWTRSVHSGVNYSYIWLRNSEVCDGAPNVAHGISPAFRIG